MKLFCPLPRSFAVIQMDPMGMVKPYDDPIALAEAQAMKPKKYLVYLSLPKDLPTPTKPWFRYDIEPIATTLRPEEPERGITSDMAIPIYPNTTHPAGRPPIHPVEPFPFPNCYFWVSNRITVRIRRKAIRYDDSAAPKLSILETMTFSERFREDFDRMDAVRCEKFGFLDEFGLSDELSEHADPPSPPMGLAPEGTPEDSVSSLPGDADSLPEGCGIRDDTGSFDTLSSPSDHGDLPMEGSVDEILRLDLFGLNVDDTVEFMPLVDLWFEVPEHLTAETIPSPTELFEERDTIMRIIHDARERAPSDRSPFIDSGVSIDYDALSARDVGPSADLPRGPRASDLRTVDSRRQKAASTPPPPRTGISGVWRDLRCAAKRMLTGARLWRVHPPCMPYWP